MAKPKEKVIIKIRSPSALLEVWCDDVAQYELDILSVEGVDHIISFFSENHVHVWLDPRYDIEEVKAELLVLLSAEVPGVFKE